MSRRDLGWILSGALFLAATACGGGSGSSNSPPIATITAPIPTTTTLTIGRQLAFRATCTDPEGDAVFSHWTFPSGTPATSAALDGRVAWDSPGNYTISYSCTDSKGRSSSTVTRAVTVLLTSADPPKSLQAYSVTPQSGHAGLGISDPPAVKVVDQYGLGVSGVQVTFTVTAGGGSLGDGNLVSATATSGLDGVAAVASWTLGASGAQEVIASATGLPPVTLAATTDGSASRYHIQLIFLSEPSGEVRRAFTRAAERIGRVVTGELQGFRVTATADELAGCGDTAVDLQVDDLVILADVIPIDGTKGILGQAGPCFIRNAAPHHPVLGLMQFDSADLDLMSPQILDAVILHEMLHVVGIGTLWQDANVLTGAGSTDPRFTGANALSAFVSFNGGSGYASVPVENTGGGGTRDAHWRESIFKNELMTGYVNTGSNPLSRTTIASLADIGYTVDVSQADPFNITTAALLAPDTAEAEPALDLSADTLPFSPRPLPGH